jgi:hypothetical protein
MNHSAFEMKHSAFEMNHSAFEMNHSAWSDDIAYLSLRAHDRRGQPHPYMQVVPRGAGKSEDRARRAAEEARAAARKIMSAKTGTGTGVSRGSRASSDKREGGVVEVGSRVEPTEEFRQRWSGGGPIPNGGVVEQVSDEAVVVKRGDGSSFAFNPSDVSLVTADERSSPLQKEDGTGAGGGSRGAEAGAQVGGRGEFGSGRKEGKREKDKAKAPIGKGWAFDMYEKKQEEIRKIKEAAAARRGRIESEKKEAKERRKMWRKKLGAKTRRGQPVMQVVRPPPHPHPSCPPCSPHRDVAKHITLHPGVRLRASYA